MKINFQDNFLAMLVSLCMSSDNLVRMMGEQREALQWGKRQQLNLQVDCSTKHMKLKVHNYNTTNYNLEYIFKIW